MVSWRSPAHVADWARMTSVTPESCRLQVTFWGVRGTRPTPQESHLGVGGNTSCLEVRANADSRVLVDAGTGLIHAGIFGPQNVDLLMTHFHWDHIYGLPFFPPLFKAGSRLTFFTGHPADAARRSLESPMTGPYSPALEFALSTREYVEIDRQPFTRNAMTIHPFPLHHPQGAWGYRMESGGASIVHASDVEHGDTRLDALLRDYATGADLLIYDAQYTDAEYRSKRGWGHSTWREATRVARDARVKQLLLFHHDPTHDDRTMRAIVDEARQHFEATDIAREGEIIQI